MAKALTALERGDLSLLVQGVTLNHDLAARLVLAEKTLRYNVGRHPAVVARFQLCPDGRLSRASRDDPMADEMQLEWAGLS